MTDPAQRNEPLQWQVDDQPLNWSPPPRPQRRWKRGALAAALVIGLVVLGWRQATARRIQRLLETVQAQLALQQAAYQQGDGELLLALLADDPAWRAAHLTPEGQAWLANGGQVTAITLEGEEIWATVTWEEAGSTWQRLIFLQREGESWRQIARPAAFWGPPQSFTYAWGRLTLLQADALWAQAIADFVADRLARACLAPCPAWEVVVTDRLSVSAAPNTIHVPSPRLLGLALTGAPGAPFWNALEQRLESQLRPAVIRFAVPNHNQELTSLGYLAQRFQAQHPDISLTLVDRDTLSGPPLAWLPTVDGAILTPTLALITAGRVHDLTDLAASTPDFHSADFYPSIWAGGLWQERLWLLPLGGDMPLLFLDGERLGVSAAGVAAGDWRWEAALAYAAALAQRQTAAGRPTPFYGYLDTSLATLYAYAYNQEPAPLSSATIAATLTWYTGQLAPAGPIANLVGLNAAERQLAHINLLSSRRQAALWIDSPGQYEFQLLLKPLALLPLPAAPGDPARTPLTITGGVISSASANPQAVWAWLHFLSREAPIPLGARTIPARASVAARTHYWDNLPAALAPNLRDAFATAQAITAADSDAFGWEQLAAVVAGRQTPLEAAQRRPLPWFSAP